MNKIELTFDEAWEYLKYMVELGFSKTAIAGYIGTDRKYVSGHINNVVNKTTNKPIQVPKACYPKIIELAEKLQLEYWRKNKPT